MVAALSEGYLRASKPFMAWSMAYVDVPDVGRLLEPGSVVRYTNWLDFWTTTRVNRWGFPDREPLPRSRAEQSCHIAVIGDSFVAALEVPIAVKMHVQLEQIAASELPHLDVTTSAFGTGNTGQAAQLPYYGNYAARLKPKLVVLVFDANDFDDNANGRPWHTGVERNAGEPSAGERKGHPSQEKSPQRGTLAKEGALRLRPPSLDTAPAPPEPATYLGPWLKIKLGRSMDPRRPRRPRRAERRTSNLPLESTRFALRQFSLAVTHDDAALVILSNYRIWGPWADALASVADRIPIISQDDYLTAHGLSFQDVRWDHDGHWNPAGHRLAAQAVLEWLRANEAVCLANAAR